MKMRITLPLLLTLMCLTLAVVPAMATQIYTNGGPTAVSSSWSINGTDTTSNSFTCSFLSCTITSLTFYATTPTFSPGATIALSITSGEDFGINYGSELSLLPTPVPCNPLGQCIYTVPTSFLALRTGTYWLNVTGGPPPFSWWESFGPSQASFIAESGATLFNIPSEAFTLNGTVTAVPEPGSIMLLGSGVLGLAGVLRRKLNR